MKLKPYSDYRDSFLPWVGAIPTHWKTERAKRLFTRMERPVRPEDETITCFRDGVVTLRKNRRTTGFTESLKEIGYQGIRKGDLVIHAMDAFAGAIGVSDSDGKGTPVYAVCQPKEDVDPEYYARIVREMARSQYIAALATGIRQRSTDFRYSTFATESVPVPPPDEQQVISWFLINFERRFSRLIRAKQRLIALLNEQKQAIIQRAVTRGLDPDVPLKPTGVAWLGDVPAHWDVLPLKRVLLKLVDCEHKTAPAVESSEYVVARTSSIREGSYRPEGSYFNNGAGFREWTKREIPQAGDILFTREAPAGEACLVPEGIDLCLGQRVVLMRVDNRKYDANFAILTIYGGPPAEYVRMQSQGSTVPHFNMSDIAAMVVFVPPLHEQTEIVEYVHKHTQVLDQTIEQARREIDLIREYRTRLIADVVTGKLDVHGVAVPDLNEEGAVDAPDDDTLGELAAEEESL